MRLHRSIALALGLMAGALSAAAPTVTLKVSATAHGPNVMLGDVVEGLPSEAASTVLRASGLPGGNVSVDAAFVALKLRRAPGGPYALSGPASCKVDVPSQTVPGSVLQTFGHDYLAKQLSGSAGASLKDLGKVADLKLYDGALRFETEPLSDWQLRGNVVLRVRVLQDSPDGREHEAATVPLSFMIERREPRLVAIKTIRKGEPLGPENLALEEGDTTYVDRGFSSFDEVEGRSARAYVGQGKVLTHSMVEFPPLVKRNDIVRVMIRSGGVIIEGSAKALRDARKDETLPVEMEGTRKRLQARCVEAGVVVYEAR